MPKLFVGADVGSVSTNLVVLDEAGAVLFKKYYRNDGQPLKRVKQDHTTIAVWGDKCGRYSNEISA